MVLLHLLSCASVRNRIDTGHVGARQYISVNIDERIWAAVFFAMMPSSRRS